MGNSNESFKSVHDPFEEKYDFAKNFEEQRKKKNEKTNTREANKKKDEQEMSLDKKVFHLAENNLNLSNFDGVRMFLANLGFLTPFRNMDLSVFDKEKVNAHLQTSINLLDSALGKDLFENL